MHGFSVFLMQSKEKRVPARRYLFRVREYMMDPSTRARAYELTAAEFNVSVNALRIAGFRARLTKDDHSLKFALPLAYEKALVSAVILYSRQGTPLLKHDFAVLASKLAKKKKGHIFSPDFVDYFVERYNKDICIQGGELLSPTRCFESMLDKTKEFISSLDNLFAANIINKNNKVVF